MFLYLIMITKVERARLGSLIVIKNFHYLNLILNYYSLGVCSMCVLVHVCASIHVRVWFHKCVHVYEGQWLTLFII